MQHHITALLAFISTNVDDIFILMLFFSAKRFKSSSIFIGQYLGIGALVVISLIGSYVGNLVDQRYVGLLGLFPIYLAIKNIIDLVKHQSDGDNEVSVKSDSVLAIAGVTIANGADNIGVYVPLLTTMTATEKTTMIIVFAIMTYIWCVIGKYLASRPLIAKQLDKFGHIVMPIVLFLLGVFILFDSGTFGLLKIG